MTHTHTSHRIIQSDDDRDKDEDKDKQTKQIERATNPKA